MVFGGVVINNTAQARRERVAREAERARALADRRETFELAHLQDLHAELSELLLVAEDNIIHWCRWLRLADAPPTPGRPAEELSAVREEIMTAAVEFERSAATHGEEINRLAWLIIPDRLRSRVVNAYGQYERLYDALSVDSPDVVQGALPGVLAEMQEVRRDVAGRIRDIYVSAENLPSATDESR